MLHIPWIQNLIKVATGCGRNHKNTKHKIKKKFTEVFPAGYSSRNVKFTTHFHPISRLRMSESVPPFPHMPSWG